MASVYPSTGWATLRRTVFSGFAASDIVQGAPVCVASSADDGFIMCTSSTQKPVGVARDYAIAGNAIAVQDFGNEVRANVAGMGVGGSFSRQSYVGVTGTSQAVHPQSGVTVTTPVLGQVTTAVGATAVGGSGVPLWAVGIAYESAATGDFAKYRVEPALLSGITSSN